MKSEKNAKFFKNFSSDFGSFIKLFDAGLQCEFILTFFRILHSANFAKSNFAYKNVKLASMHFTGQFLMPSKASISSKYQPMFNKVGSKINKIFDFHKLTGMRHGPIYNH